MSSSPPFPGSSSYSLPPILSKAKRKAPPSHLEHFAPDKKTTTASPQFAALAINSTRLSPASSFSPSSYSSFRPIGSLSPAPSSFTMKFDELMVRKWLDQHPDQAAALLHEYASRTSPSSIGAPQTNLGDAVLETVQNSNYNDSQEQQPKQQYTFRTSLPGPFEAEFLKTPNLPTEVIFDIARLIYSSLDLPTVLESVLSIAVNLLGAERCSVFLLDKEKNELYTLAFDVGGSKGALLEETVSAFQQQRDTSERTMMGSIETAGGPSSLENSGRTLAQCHVIDEEEEAERSRLLAQTTRQHNRHMHSEKRAYFNPGIRVPVGTGLVGYVAQTRQGLNIHDAYADPRFNPEVDRKTGFVTHSVLCLPIFGPVVEGGAQQPELVGVASLVNKEQQSQQGSTDSNANSPRQRVGFSEEDTIMFRNVLVLVGIAIRNAQLYQTAIETQHKANELAQYNGQLYAQAQQEAERTNILLRLAKNLYHEDNTKDLVTKIVGLAKEFAHSDKSSLFLVDKEKNQLYSSVFDNGTETKMTLPLEKGLLGIVATQGRSLNIPDAYLDPRFNPEIDIKTNYRTGSILSVPVFGPKNEIMGVLSLINKLGESKHVIPFDSRDESLLESFSIFCGLALRKTMMLEALETQRNQLALTMEMMSFHATVKDEDVQQYQRNKETRIIPIERLRSHCFDPHIFGHFDEHLPVVVHQMFDDLAYGERYDIATDKLIRYILTVRQNYRPVAYHNFTHATSVTHTLYYLIVNGVLDEFLDPLELFSMLVACLNHDIDHRGTNNQFQKNAQTTLASFYTTSVMERHHFNHAMTILNGDGRLNILSSLSNSQYRRCLHLIEHAILATDLSIFFANKGKCAEMIRNGGYNKQNLLHRDLLRGLLMTCSDLGAMFKPWENAQKTADVVYEEFFAQGDEELRRGLPLSGELMDRNKMAEIPRMQYDFYNFVVLPAYEMLVNILGPNESKVSALLNGIRSNATKWKDLKESGTKYQFGMKI